MIAGSHGARCSGTSGTRSFFRDDWVRRGFLAFFFPRAFLFAPGSGKTSIVQRTLRPARRGTVRLATATVDRNAHAGHIFLRDRMIADAAVTKR